MNKDRCIVCKRSITAPTFPGFGNGDVHCPVCGDYSVSEEFYQDGISQDAVPPAQVHILQGWLRHQNLEGPAALVLTEGRCAEIVKSVPNYTPSQKMDQLLMALAKISKRPGQAANVDLNNDYPLAYAEDIHEADEYRRWLDERGLLSVHSGLTSLMLSASGWDRAHALLAASPGQGVTVFVATWFDDALDTAWSKGIKVAIEDCQLIPVRLKEVDHNEKIDDKIISEIRQCRFVVADVTGARPAVYYEAGFAHGLSKQVLWTCREDEESKLCFDTRQFSHILWKEPSDLRTKLANKIKALNLARTQSTT